MPKLQCTCGMVLNYGQIPCPDEWLLISDVEFDRYSGSVDVEKVYAAMKSLLKCPQCNRLYIFWDGFDRDPEIFISE
jgi:hypothetical protein